MKRMVLKILFLSSSFILCLSFLNINAKNLNIKEGEDLVFAILSDIHINEKDKSKSGKLEKAMYSINKKNTQIDKFIFTGDYTNSGSHEEYKMFNEIYSRNVSDKDKRIVLMGNHDYWNGLDVKSSKKRFEKEVKQDLYISENIKGYTFISLSSENDYINGYYSEESLSFAIKEIKKSINNDPNKPIFIFTHHPPKDTIYGSYDWGNNELREVFKEYPQVILFAGHSHFPLNDERGIYQENYTVVNCGGIGGIGLEEGKIEGKFPSDIQNESQGLIVKVDKNNNVTITRMDYYRNKEIKKPWIIDDFNKENFKYINIMKNNKAPYFESNSNIKLESREVGTLNIIFNQATDDDMVHSYKVDVYEKKVNENSKAITEFKVQEKYIFSKFYLGEDIPNKISVKIFNINNNKDYIVKIYAIDSFGNVSCEYLKCEIPKID